MLQHACYVLQERSSFSARHDEASRHFTA